MTTVTVTLKTVASAPVSGKTVTLGQGGGTSTISAASGASNASGVVTFTVSSTTAQVVTYTATDTTDSVTVTQTAVVAFTTPQAPDNVDQGIYCPEGQKYDPFTGGGKCVPDVTQQMPVTKLVITQQPAAPGNRDVRETYTRVAAFTPLSPALKVEGRDASNRLVASYATPITATCFYNGPEDPSPTAKQGLVGTPMTATPVGGVATFTGFSCPNGLDGGAGYFYVVLSTGATGLGGLTVYSNDFIVTPGEASTCPAGRVPLNGNCTPAPAGSYAPAGASTATQCATGTFSDIAGQSSCKPCPTGTNSAVGATSCTAEVGQLTNASITPSSTSAGASNVTYTVTFTTPVDIRLYGKINVSLKGIKTTNALAQVKSSSLSVSDTTVDAGSGTLTVVSGFSVPAGTFSFTFVGTNPTSQGARSDIEISVTNSAGTTQARTSTGTMPAIIGPATKLAFVGQPAGATANKAFTTQPRVALQDDARNQTLESGLAHLVIKRGTGTAGAQLSCTGNANGISITGGIGAFAGCTINQPGTGYVLVARYGTQVSFDLGVTGGDMDPASAESEPFTVAPAGAEPPKLTGLALVPEGWTTPSDFNYRTLVDGQTAYEVAVPGSARQFVFASAAEDVTVTLTRGGVEFDPNATPVTVPETVTITLRSKTSSATASYTLTLTTPACVAGTTFSASGNAPCAPATVCPDGEVESAAPTRTTDRTCRVVPAITNAAITLSSTLPGATGVTLTVTFTNPVAIPSGGEIRVALRGFGVSGTTELSGLSGSAGLGGSEQLTVTTYNTIPAGVVTFTVRNIKNPAAQAALTNVVFEATGNGGRISPTIARTSSGTLVAITAPPITGAAITASTTLPRATNVTYTVTFTTSSAVPAGGTIQVAMPGFAFRNSPVATFTAPSALANYVNYGDGRLTITTVAGFAAGSTVTFTVTGGTNPAAQAAQTNVVIETTTAAGTTIDRTSSGTLVAFVNRPVTNVSFELSSTAPNTEVTVTVKFTTQTAVPSGSFIVSMPGFTGSQFATPDSTTELGTAVGASGRWASGVFSYSPLSTVQPGAKSMTFKATTPAAGKIDKATLTVQTYDATNMIDAPGAADQDIVIAAPTTPQLTALALVPTQASFERITVPVVAGQTEYEVEVVAYDGATKAPTYNVSATMSDPAATVKILVGGLEWDPTGIALQSGNSATFTATRSSGKSPTYTIRLRAGATAVTKVSFTADPTTPSVNTNLNVTFVPTTTLVAGDTVTVTATGYTFTGANVLQRVVVQGGNGSATPATFRSSGTAAVVVTIPTGSTFPAGVAGTVALSVTNPAAQTLAKAGLTVATSRDTTAVASGNDIVISTALVCQNGGTLDAATNTCSCPTGYSGTLCETAVPRTLVFTTSPAATIVAGTPFTIAVTAQGASGQTVNASGSVGFLLYNVANCPRGSTAFCIAASGPWSGTLTNGVATVSAITLTEDALGLGQYYFRATYTPAGQQTALRAESDVFTLEAAAPKKLAFKAPPASATVDTAFILTVGTYNGTTADTTATPRITLSSTPTGVTGIAPLSATAGTAAFTGLKFPSVGTYTVSASAAGYPSVTTSIKVQAKAGPAAKIVFKTAPPTSISAGKEFSVEVEVQDASSVPVTSAAGTVSLSYTATTGSGALQGGTAGLSVTPTAGTGRAVISGLKIGTSAATATGTITATYGTFTVTSATITATRSLSYLAFPAVPSFETSGTAFTTQPQVTAYATDGLPLTTQTGSVTLTISPRTGNVGTATLSTVTTTQSLTVPFTNGVASFVGLKATGGTGEYVLTATLVGGTTSTSTNFSLYADAVAAATASSKERSQSTTFTLKLATDTGTIDSTAKRLSTEAAIRADMCLTAGLAAANCNIVVTISKATEQTASTVMVPDDVVRAAQVAPGDASGGNEVTISALVLAALERATGAAPAGTSILSAFGLSARTPDGQKLERPSTGAFRVSLLVAASEVLSSTVPGDLKAAGWDSSAKRWVYLPGQVQQNADGSFTITTTVDFYGVVAVVFAPGAGRIAAFNGYSADGSGFGVFEGGYVDDLASAAAQNEADGVWAQDSLGLYRLLVVNGPAFLSKDFRDAFAGGVQVNSAVTLVQAQPAQPARAASTAPASTAPAAAAPTVTSTGAAGTYTVTATDTLSGIAARFGVDQTRLAAANNIAGPAFVVRAGQVLTIPATGGSSTYTVTGTDTLSGIGARFNIDWMRIAEANGIAGPNYLVRAGQVLNIPAR